MEMNKNQLIMAVVGGAGAAIALVVASIVFMNSSELDTLRENIRSNSESCNAKRGITRSIGKAIEKECEELSDSAQSVYESLTNSAVVGEIPERTALQKRMNADYERYKKLPANSERKIIADDFSFGPFGGYIKGTIPSEKETPNLARRWSDVSELTDILVNVNATQLLDVKITTKKPDDTLAANSRQNRNRFTRAKNNVKEVASKYACTEESYELTFLARPAALVKFMNAIAESKRFYVVDSIKFSQANDPLLKMIGADAKEDARKNKKKEDLEAKSDFAGTKVCVTDPATTEPFTVTIKLTTMIFGDNKEAK